MALAGGLLAATATGPPPARAATRPPVVLIVLDEFPVDSMLLPDGRIDARRFPGFASLARHSTWFPNAGAVYDSTFVAVPSILTGHLPGQPSFPGSIFTVLDRAGYRMNAFEETNSTCPKRLCPRRGTYGKFFENVLHRRRERLNKTIGSLRPTRRPVFTYHHTLLPHVPWNYLPSGRLRGGYSRGNLPDFSTTTGFGDAYLTHVNLQRHVLQVGFVDHEVGLLMRRLKRTGLLKRALLVVTADHGIAFQVGVGDRRQVSTGNLDQIASIPLFIKAPGQTRGRVNRAYARSTDLVPTMTRMLKLRPPAGVDGANAFGAAVRKRGGVQMLSRDFSHYISLPGAEVKRRRRLVRDSNARLLGTGSWADVFRIGPHRELLGRQVGSEAMTSSGAAAELVVPEGVDHIGPEDASAHSGTAGQISGGLPGQTRDLAVAVNGRIAAMGRSFHLSNDPREFFWIGYPEGTLRTGRNTVALYEVTGSGPSLRLARIGSTG